MKILKQEDKDKLQRAITEFAEFRNLENQKEEYGTATFTASGEERKDRHGTLIKQDGLDWDEYRKNPVILADHYMGTDNIVGKATEIKRVGKETHITLVWAGTEKAQGLRKLYEDKFPLMMSIGFSVKKRNEEDENIIEEAEVVESSVVSVGSYRDAVARGVSEETLTRAVELGVLQREAEEEKEEKPNLEKDIAEIKSGIKTILNILASEETEEETDDERKLDGIVKMLQGTVTRQSEALRNLKKIRNEQ